MGRAVTVRPAPRMRIRSKQRRLAAPFRPSDVVDVRPGPPKVEAARIVGVFHDVSRKDHSANRGPTGRSI